MHSMKIGASFLALLTVGTVLCFKWGLLASELDLAVNGPKSVAERVKQYGDGVESRLKPAFDKAGVAYPPQVITLVVLKQEKQVELYAKDNESGLYRFINVYPILAASGHLGPKLQEGDWQVPEGVYGVESLNPNSHYHLALHVDYPSSFDQAKAKLDGRTDLGGDIMIHGSNVSIGCVAVGDSAAEDFFVLVAQTGNANVHLLFCPFDFRLVHSKLDASGMPLWISELYDDLSERLNKLPLPPTPTAPAP
jgi:murein L,D-transpeptidase YafK